MSKRIGSRIVLLQFTLQAVLLYFCAPSSAAGQMSGELASSADASAAAPTPYIYWTNDKNGSVGRAGIAGTGVNTNSYPRQAGV